MKLVERVALIGRSANVVVHADDIEAMKSDPLSKKAKDARHKLTLLAVNDDETFKSLQETLRRKNIHTNFGIEHVVSKALEEKVGSGFDKKRESVPSREVEPRFPPSLTFLQFKGSLNRSRGRPVASPPAFSPIQKTKTNMQSQYCQDSTASRRIEESPFSRTRALGSHLRGGSLAQRSIEERHKELRSSLESAIRVAELESDVSNNESQVFGSLEDPKNFDMLLEFPRKRFGQSMIDQRLSVKAAETVLNAKCEEKNGPMAHAKPHVVVGFNLHSGRTRRRGGAA